MRLSSLPAEERPRERLRRRGAASLSVPELLAILLRTGSRGKDVLELSADVLGKFGDLRGLAKASDEEMMELPGLGDAKACVLLAAMELAKRLSCQRDETTASEGWRARVERLAGELADEEREFIFAIHTRRNGSVIQEDRLSFGGAEGAFLDVKYLLRRCVRLNSHGLILVHNHPDGSLQPSVDDIKLTDFLSRRTQILGIDLLGHFVVANGESRRISLAGEPWKAGMDAGV
ncbi:MAG: DNA repair protein RadC [Synergistaceae bacterium]|nr:DNA repair protein RadC [Synergistota bacterium]NLM71682.1 DNA repair protein RadC [Synergistaceae bacterium]